MRLICEIAIALAQFKVRQTGGSDKELPPSLRNVRGMIVLGPGLNHFAYLKNSNDCLSVRHIYMYIYDIICLVRYIAVSVLRLAISSSSRSSLFRTSLLFLFSRCYWIILVEYIAPTNAEFVARFCGRLLSCVITRQKRSKSEWYRARARGDDCDSNNPT